MRRLVIDDVRTFTFDADYARTLWEGMVALKHTMYDEIWLDHDLGMIDGNDETIRPLVRSLEYLGHSGTPYPCQKIYVHTANGIGRDWMMQALSPYYNVEAVWAPDYMRK